MEVETRDNLLSTKNELIEAVVKAALHCRGDEDVTLGKVLDEKSSSKRAVGGMSFLKRSDKCVRQEWEKRLHLLVNGANCKIIFFYVL